MRWLGLIILFAAVATIATEPDPKKYKSEVKDKQSSSTLTDEERNFLREVEEKFGIKADLPVEAKKDSDESKLKAAVQGKLPFPAVIAIEIVNDTDSKTKGKRTIDANLGYGYRTNTGYTYTYFGKQAHDKGKFMVYPYSQEDILPGKSSSYSSFQSGKYTTSSPSVEIQPSQAYELVPVKEEEVSYQHNKPITEYMNKYENVKGIEAPPPPYSNPSHPTTLYTTYNGEQFSGLSGQFPKVMSNYLVDSSQLLKNPEYQNAGLTQDYIKQHGQQLEHRVVPVLVLRIPSSYIKNPSAELYANLKQDYPLSQYLNQINLQQLVNQYFKKIGIPNAPQVMTYSSLPISQSHPATSHSVSSHQSHNYAAPYVRPSYTHADYSGLQYSAVQPVMAKYPSSNPAQQYYVSQPQSSYRQPSEQQYEYQYKYVPQSEGQEQEYYVPQYQYQTQEAGQEEATAEQDSHVQYSSEEYGVPQQSAAQSPHYSSNYELPRTSQMQYEKSQSVYELPKEDSMNYAMKNEESSYASPTKDFVSAYRNSKPQYVIQTETPRAQTYYQPSTPKEAVAIIPHSSQSVQNYHVHSEPSGAQTYVYHKQTHDDASSGDDLVLTENYPSKDHTIATVLPNSYKVTKENKPVQTINYVTPVPYSSKYQSQYRTMVPQTILKGPTQEKVSYVNSHSVPKHYHHEVQIDYSAEKEYTTDAQYLPPVGSQKAPSYPRNYHSHPKRMAKPEPKPEHEVPMTTSKKTNDRHTKKKMT